MLGARDDPRAHLSSLKHAIGMVDVKAHHGTMCLGEYLELACKVILEIGMLDGRDMVLTDVDEASDGKVDPKGAVVLEGLARRLHHQLACAHRGGVSDMSLELEGLRGGELRGSARDAVVENVGGEDGSGMGAECAGSSVKHALEIESAGRLALGACEGARLNAARGVVVEHVGQDAHGAAHVVHEHARRLDAIERLLGKIAECPRRKRLLQVLALERAALAHKERAGHNLARVGRDEIDQGLLAALGQPHLVQNACRLQRLCVG